MDDSWTASTAVTGKNFITAFITVCVPEGEYKHCGKKIMSTNGQSIKLRITGGKVALINVSD